MVAILAVAGRYRGRLRHIREYEIVAEEEEAVRAVRIRRVKNPPWGIAGRPSRVGLAERCEPGRTAREQMLGAPLWTAIG